MTDYGKIHSLYVAGKTARENGQYRQAAALYEEAYGLAERASDELIGGRYVAIFRRNAAHSFKATSRLREALAVLTPLKRNSKVPSCCVYGNMTDHFRIALDLPVRLQTIERNYAEAESFYRASGGSSWKSRILNMKAELLLARGMLDEALRAALEGWTLRDDDCPNHYATTHISTLVRIHLARGEAYKARAHLNNWSKHDESNQTMVRVEYHTLSSSVSRLDGSLDAAVDSARQAVQFAEIADWGEERYAAHAALARAFIVAGEHHRAREVLARLAPLRRSESGHERYAFQLLRGDFHLARARAAAHLSQRDDEFDISHTPDVTPWTGQPARPDRELQQARAAYLAAQEVGNWVDEQLECSSRAAEVSERLRRLEEVAASPWLR